MARFGSIRGGGKGLQGQPVMSPVDALLSLFRRGFQVRSDGARLYVKPSPVPPDVDALVREHKADWLCLLCEASGDPWADGFAGEAWDGACWELLNGLRRDRG
jgi:hypothetical protein